MALADRQWGETCMQGVLKVKQRIRIKAHRSCSAIGCVGVLRLPMILISIALTVCPTAQGKEPAAAAVSIPSVNALLAGRYDNSAQVAQGKATGANPASQHVTITIEPTQQADWDFWRVHMDVDPAVAQSAGSDTSLDAVWAMNLARETDGKSLELIPFTLNPTVDAATVKASAFDKTQWLLLEACALHGDFAKSPLVAQVPPNEMCVAETMGLGGKRAFLPTWMKREGDELQIQLIYFGKPWRVEARRLSNPTTDGH
jgi:hypothetical protein